MMVSHRQTGMNDRPAGAHGHMSAEEFRSHGHRVVDMIADYWDWLRSDSPPRGVRTARR